MRVYEKIADTNPELGAVICPLVSKVLRRENGAKSQ